MENTHQHPSAYIAAGDVHIIRIHAPDAEKLGMLHPEQLKIIYRNDWFKLLIPQTYAGQQVDLLRLLHLQEAVSWADGSTGWVVTLCNGAGWFGGFLAPATANRVFADPRICLAGSGAPAGTAEITANGYVVNGTWKYASGAHHATHITANCIITKYGQPVLNDDSQPLILPFIFDKKDVLILPAWKYIGMIATGSDTFAVEDLQVAPDRQFKIDPAATIIDDPLYHYPFLQLAEATITVNLSGMAIHFMDLCEDIFREKAKQPRLTDDQKIFLTNELGRAKKEMELLRRAFYEAADQSWIGVQKNAAIPGAILHRVSTTSLQLAHQSREIVDRLYPLCGLVAASTGSEINRAWRDLHTASQHALLTFSSPES